MEEVATNKGKIYKALSALQAELTPIERTKEVEVRMKTGGVYKFKYAPLDEIMKTLYPLLGKNELSLRHELHAGGIEAVLMHSSGEELRSGAIKVATTGDMQSIGGQITYARRYSVTMLMGIASDEDNDAADLNVPDTKHTAKDAIQNLDVTPQIAMLKKATDLINLRQIWTGFTAAQRENVELINAKEEMKAILEQEQIENTPQEAPEEDMAVPPDEDVTSTK